MGPHTQEGPAQAWRLNVGRDSPNPGSLTTRPWVHRPQGWPSASPPPCPPVSGLGRVGPGVTFSGQPVPHPGLGLIMRNRL